jgi:hypothetical protein
MQSSVTRCDSGIQIITKINFNLCQGHYTSKAKHWNYLTSLIWRLAESTPSHNLKEEIIELKKTIPTLQFTVVPRYTSLIRSRSLDLYQTGRIPNKFSP